MTIRVSVVVPTCKRPDLLARCLDALVDQCLDPDAYEIVVVDDAGDEATRRLVECQPCAGGCRAPVRYLTTRKRGPAAARNAGWRAARGEIIAFTDDDCVPDPGWLRAGLAAFVDGTIGACGSIVVPLPSAPTDYQRDATNLARALFATANCFYRRTVLEEVGGFDEEFPVAWREDSELHFRLLGLNRPLVRALEAVVIHPVRPAPWGVSVMQQRKSMYNALLYKKHPGRYRQLVQPSPPWHYYAIDAALLAALLARLIGRSRLARGSAALWLLLTGRFCVQRLRGTSHAPRHIAEMAVTSAIIPPISTFWRLRGAIKYRVLFF